jgi:hypothetical protein
MHHPVSWCRTSERHFAADLGRVGSLMVWVDAATGGTWSAFVLGTQRTGFLTAAATQAAALRLARAQLEEGLRAGSRRWRRQRRWRRPRLVPMGMVLVPVSAHRRDRPGQRSG